MVSRIIPAFRVYFVLVAALCIVVPAIAQIVVLIVHSNAVQELSAERDLSESRSASEAATSLLVEEKASHLSATVGAAIAVLNLTGNAAQRIVDNRQNLSSLSLWDTPLFGSRPAGGVSGGADYSLARSPTGTTAQDFLRSSALLNLFGDMVPKIYRSVVKLYIVGPPENPFVRSFPAAEESDPLRLGSSATLQTDYRARAAEWTQWFLYPEMRERFQSPLTVEGPYLRKTDGLQILSMYYPLWDSQTKKIAGVVGLDYNLSRLIELSLSTRLGKNGFAFIVDGAGTVIAIPESGRRLFQLEAAQDSGDQGPASLKLSDSKLDVIRDLVTELRKGESGLLHVSIPLSLPGAEGVLSGAEPDRQKHMLVYRVFRPMTLTGYAQDQWRLIVDLREDEILDAGAQLSSDIGNLDLRAVFLSVFIMIAGVVAGLFLTNLGLKNLRAPIPGDSFKLVDVPASPGPVGDSASFRAAGHLQTRYMETSSVAVLPDVDNDLDIAFLDKEHDPAQGPLYRFHHIGQTLYIEFGPQRPGTVLESLKLITRISLGKALRPSKEVETIKQLLADGSDESIAMIEYQDKLFSIVGHHVSVAILRSNGVIDDFENPRNGGDFEERGLILRTGDVLVIALSDPDIADSVNLELSRSLGHVAFRNSRTAVATRVSAREILGLLVSDPDQQYADNCAFLVICPVE